MKLIVFVSTYAFFESDLTEVGRFTRDKFLKRREDILKEYKTTFDTKLECLLETTEMKHVRVDSMLIKSGIVLLRHTDILYIT